MSKRFWNSDKFMSFFAILLSVGTLTVFIYQTNLIRKQQYASAYPYLELGFHRGGLPDMEYVLSNVGVGPAILDEIEITEKGELYKGRFSEYLSEISTRNPTDSIYFVYSDISPGKMVPAGKSISLFATKDLYSARRIVQLIEENQVELKITYRSIYDERWVIDADVGIPVKLD